MKVHSLLTIITLGLAFASGCALEVAPDDMADPQSFELLAEDGEAGWATETDAFEHDLEDEAYELWDSHELGAPQVEQTPELSAQADPDPTPWRSAADPIPDPWDAP